MCSKAGEVARADIYTGGESGSTQAVEDAVADILADVKKNGDAAVLRYCEKKFDGVKLAGLRVAQADIDAAYEAADPEFIRTLTMAAGNIEAFHKRQIRRNFVINDTPGVVLGQKVTPIERVGLYARRHGQLPSSVLMNAIPARLAGVSEIIMVTPPAKDGSVALAILTAGVAGVDGHLQNGRRAEWRWPGTESVPRWIRSSARKLFCGRRQAPGIRHRGHRHDRRPQRDTGAGRRWRTPPVWQRTC